MKKSYVKPQVYFESFQLSASIAGTCTPGLTNASSTNQGCKVIVDDPGLATMTGLFLDLFGCTITDAPEGFCYQTAAEGKTLLTS